MTKMDPSSKSQETTEEQQQNHQLQTITKSPFATASISLSLSNIITTSKTTLILPKFQSFQQTHQPNNLKIPSQASSLSISSSLILTPSRPKLFPKSTISAAPLHHPLTNNPRRSSDPSNSAAIRRASIVWFRNDLRLHDNECLNAANNDSTSLLPLFCFDPLEFKSSTSVTETLRASFLIEAVSNLRDNLRSKGSDLIVRVGNPKTILIDIAKSVGAEAIYAHRGISKTESKSELAIEAAMKEEGVEFKSFWGNTLVHIDDLPFDLESMPTTHDQFRSKVGNSKPRKTIAALEQVKGKPARCDVDAGEIPGLKDLGLDSGPMATFNGPLGGESEAQKKVKSIVAEFKAHVPNKSGKNGVESVYGATFLSKLNPWLATGCVSVKAVFEEIKNSGSGNGGMGAIANELMWRDFFSFVTKKCSIENRSGVAPVAAGALA